jgi:hypothetical protein
MALTTAGAQFIAKAITGLNSPVLFSMPVSGVGYHLGVGDSATAFAIGQTDLQAASNKLRVAVTSVNESGGVITAIASFGTSQANFAWEEWGSFNNVSGSTMYQRKVDSLGTKTSAQVWTLTATLTHAAA